MADFVDTNILLYSISTKPDEAAKRDTSRKILDQDDLVLSVQVLQEFYVQATRASRQDPLPHELAVDFIDTWRRFHIEPNTVAVMNGALRLKAMTGFHYWDCAVIAAAQNAACTAMLTEDMAHGQIIGGIRIVNPFL